MVNYNYEKAFSRNIGWFTPEDQALLRTKRIAIPGLGGVGGHHLHGLLRLGIEKFNLADPDTFEIHNFNRQQGAYLNSIGRMKIEVAEELAKAINPNTDVRSFPKGVTTDNMEEFLKDVDLIIDALDLYAMDVRVALYELAQKKRIPIVTAGPFGMGTSCIAFNPDILGFNDYFDLLKPNLTNEAKIIRFLAGVSPSLMHRKYLRHPSAINLFERKLPSLNIGCFSAGAAAGSLVIKILLDPNDPTIRWAPHGFHVDFNLQKSYRFYRPWGNRNPLQWLIIKAYHQVFKKDEYLK